MAYSTDIFGGCTGLVKCLADWANTVTDGAFWTVILLAFGVIIFMATFGFGVNRAFGFASIAGVFRALMLSAVNLISNPIAIFFYIVGGVGIVVMRVGER